MYQLSLITKLNNYFEEVEVFVEYQVLEIAPPNDGGESGSEPMPPESEGTENPPSSESGQTIIEKLLSVLEENMFIVATTGFAVLSIFIVFGMTMSFKKKD